MGNGKNARAAAKPHKHHENSVLLIYLVPIKLTND